MNQQPKALKVFFLTEMWEQYAFYTLQPLLVFLLIKKLSYSDADAYLFTGQFTGLVYLTPVIGGWIADHFLGKRIAALLGGLFLCIGYALIALGEHTLFIGLSFVIVGHGLFKPNIVSFLGEFYSRYDSRREAGFTLFYVGINIGALLAMFCAGYIQKLLGWAACFGVASFMLLLGMSFFRWGFRYFADKGLPPEFSTETLTAFLRKKPISIALLFISLMLAYYSLTVIRFGDYSLYSCGILFCLYIAKIAWKLDENARRNILALMLLFIIAIFYKTMFFETYLVVNVFTDRVVDRTLFGHEIPAIVFLGLGGFFSILLGPLWAKIWQSKKIKCSIPVKFTLSILIIAGCMQMLAWLTTETNTLLPPIWIILFRLVFAISELFIFPIAFAAISKYAPNNYTGIMMGGWFMSAAFAGKLAGVLASYADVPKGITDLYQLNIIYHHAFQYYAALNFAVFFICLILAPIIHKLLRKNEGNYEQISIAH